MAKEVIGETVFVVKPKDLYDALVKRDEQAWEGMKERFAPDDIEIVRAKLADRINEILETAADSIIVRITIGKAKLKAYENLQRILRDTSLTPSSRNLVENILHRIAQITIFGLNRSVDPNTERNEQLEELSWQIEKCRDEIWNWINVSREGIDMSK